MKKLFKYFKASIYEVAKINWPDHQTTRHLTVAVIVYAVVLAGFIGAIDAGLSEVVKKVLIK